MAEKFVALKNEVGGELKEILLGEKAFNNNIPNASYIPAIPVIVMTTDGRAYSGFIQVKPLMAHLKKVR